MPSGIAPGGPAPSAWIPCHPGGSGPPGGGRWYPLRQEAGDGDLGLRVLDVSSAAAGEQRLDRPPVESGPLLERRTVSRRGLLGEPGDLHGGGVNLLREDSRGEEEASSEHGDVLGR